MILIIGTIQFQILHVKNLIYKLIKNNQYEHDQ